VTIEFCGEIVEWRGPAPFLFVPIPSDLSAEIKSIASFVTYGWGCIPVIATIGGTSYKTSLFPKNGAYWVPVKVLIQKTENVKLGDQVFVKIVISASM
jgi:Domain of unknown function (DUF1905)